MIECTCRTLSCTIFGKKFWVKKCIFESPKNGFSGCQKWPKLISRKSCAIERASFLRKFHFDVFRFKGFFEDFRIFGGVNAISIRNENFNIFQLPFLHRAIINCFHILKVNYYQKLKKMKIDHPPFFLTFIFH